MDKKFEKLAFFLILLPVVFFYFQMPAFQFDVGTDYMSYVDMYKYGYNIEYYYNKKEYVFYYILRVSTALRFGEQSIFILVSVVYSVFWLYFIFLLKNAGYKVWVFVFLYFTVTGIYQNQLNGLRQYMAIAILPCLFIVLYNRQYFVAMVLTVLASLCHASFILVYPFFIFIYLKPTPFRVLFLFLFSFIVSALVVPKLLPFIVSTLFGSYAGYFESALSASANLVSVITKLYYMPLFLLAMYTYRKEVKLGVYDDSYDMVMRFFMILAATYWLFIVNMYFGFFGRVAQYFMIFYIFPIYYLITQYIKKNKVYSTILVICYILLPYFLKVTFLATSEYDYNSILKGL